MECSLAQASGTERAWKRNRENVKPVELRERKKTPFRTLLPINIGWRTCLEISKQNKWTMANMIVAEQRKPTVQNEKQRQQ